MFHGSHTQNVSMLPTFMFATSGAAMHHGVDVAGGVHAARGHQ